MGTAYPHGSKIRREQQSCRTVDTPNLASHECTGWSLLQQARSRYRWW